MSERGNWGVVRGGSHACNISVCICSISVDVRRVLGVGVLDKLEQARMNFIAEKAVMMQGLARMHIAKQKLRALKKAKAEEEKLLDASKNPHEQHVNAATAALENEGHPGNLRPVPIGPDGPSPDETVSRAFIFIKTLIDVFTFID